MKKHVCLLLIGLLIPFSVSAETLDFNSPKTQSFVQQLKAQFFTQQQERFNEQRESILERLRKYRFVKNQSKEQTTNQQVLGGVMPESTSTVKSPAKNTYTLPAVQTLADDSCMDPNSTNPACRRTTNSPQTNPQVQAPPMTPSTQPIQGTADIDLSKLQKKYPGSKMTYFVDKPFMGDTRKAPGAEAKATQYENTFWTKWMNRDAPTGTGDWEQYSDFQKLYPGVCKDKYPLDTECQTADGNPYYANKQVIQRCSYGGFICENVAQQGGRCKDYKSRFLCGGTPPPEEEEKDPVTSNAEFNTQINYTAPEKPGYEPTKYEDTITRDSDTTTYQYGCKTSVIDGICERYELETSQGEIDPYQREKPFVTPNQQVLGGNMPTGIDLPVSHDTPTRDDYLYSKEKFDKNIEQPTTLPERIQRYNGESRYERLKRIQELMKLQYKNR